MTLSLRLSPVGDDGITDAQDSVDEAKEQHKSAMELLHEAAESQSENVSSLSKI